MFVYIKCRCGRTLRGRRLPERTTVHCWECGNEVVVPRFRARGSGPNPLARLRGAGTIRAVETVAATILLALATTAVLPIPRAGGWIALGIIAVSGLLYLGRIADAAPPVEAIGSDDGVDGGVGPEARGGLNAVLREAARLALAAAFAFAVAGTFRLADGSGQVEHDPASIIDRALILGGFALWLVLPLAALALVARDESGRLGVSGTIAAVSRKPWATLIALLAPILLVVVLEGALLAVLIPTGAFGLAVVEAEPLPPGYSVVGGLLMLDTEFLFPRRIEYGAFYRYGLGRGATLIGSIPSSMANGLTPRVLVPPYGDHSTETFLAIRLLICLAAFGALYGVFAWQSARLGQIALDGSASMDLDEEDDDGEAVEPESGTLRDRRGGLGAGGAEEPGSSGLLGPARSGPGLDRSGPSGFRS